jgi:hypothetical protein
LYEVLLYAEGDDAINYAQAAHAAARLINKSVEDLDSVRIRPMIAILYGVSTARLNQQVRRNLERFPGDFMFQLTADEHNSLMLQIATSKPGRGGRRKSPLVFTDHGASWLRLCSIAR